MDIKNEFVPYIQDLYKTKEFIALHEPKFLGNEKKYVMDTLDSTFVSSVGSYVNEFENKIQDYTQSHYVVATNSGSSALHAALYLAGVRQDQLVLTPSFTFVSACNSIRQLGADPIFADIDQSTLGLSPDSVNILLKETAYLNDEGQCIHKASGKVISCMLPMHTFGHPVDLDSLLKISHEWNITLVEDAAESLGSFYKGLHTGTFGRFGIVSFNGNKIITTGGGGAILSKEKLDGEQSKHITSTARVKHAYRISHDEFAFNYRMPNITAALGCAQLENLERFVAAKRELALAYKVFFEGSDYQFFVEPEFARSNYWLNAVICENADQQESLLIHSNEAGVMTRPAWEPMHTLPMYNHCYRSDLTVSEDMAKRLVNLPSTPIINEAK